MGFLVLWISCTWSRIQRVDWQILVWHGNSILGSRCRPVKPWFSVNWVSPPLRVAPWLIDSLTTSLLPGRHSSLDFLKIPRFWQSWSHFRDFVVAAHSQFCCGKSTRIILVENWIKAYGGNEFYFISPVNKHFLGPVVLQWNNNCVFFIIITIGLLSLVVCSSMFLWPNDIQSYCICFLSWCKFEFLIRLGISR